MDTRSYCSVMPKSTYYRVDGSGRDTYISYDNGGCFRPMGKFTTTDKCNTRCRSASSKSTSKSLHYVSDGTGRDSYVKIGDGGLHSNSAQKYYLNSFKSSLRTYEPLKSINDPYTWTQNAWQTSQKRAFSREAQRKIRGCIGRLYKTKAIQ